MTAVRWRNPETRLSEAIAATAAAVHGDTVTLRMLLEVIGEQGLLIVAGLLAVPFLFPVPVPMISVILGTPILLIAVAVMLNRAPWLPDRLLNQAFPAESVRHTLGHVERQARRFEHLVRPRLLGLTAGPRVNQAHGFMLVLATITLFAPLPLVPLQNTLPGAAILLLCLGMAERDGALVLLGYLLTLVSILYVAGIVFALFHTGSAIGRWLEPLFEPLRGVFGA